MPRPRSPPSRSRPLCTGTTTRHPCKALASSPGERLTPATRSIASPGMQATAIVPIRLVGPVGIDMGISYYFSDDLGSGERLLGGTEEGLNTLAATIGLWVRP